MAGGRVQPGKQRMREPLRMTARSYAALATGQAAGDTDCRAATQH